jgi:hypothetical protein
MGHLDEHEKNQNHLNDMVNHRLDDLQERVELAEQQVITTCKLVFWYFVIMITIGALQFLARLFL